MTLSHHYSLQNNFLSLTQACMETSGWAVDTAEGMLCLKSPSSAPNFNLCWGIESAGTLAAARAFFSDKQQFVHLREKGANDTLYPLPATYQCNVTEMFLTQHKPGLASQGFDLRLVQGEEAFRLWIDVATKVFGVSDLHSYFAAIFALPHSAFFLAYRDNMPVGTGQIYMDSTGLACLSAVSVLEEHRRLGIGTAMMHCLIAHALAQGAATIGLYATETGQKLYETMGFNTARILEFSILPTSN
jgi:GNAT superfamily N-acetyltransferase